MRHAGTSLPSPHIDTKKLVSDGEFFCYKPGMALLCSCCRRSRQILIHHCNDICDDHIDDGHIIVGITDIKCYIKSMVKNASNGRFAKSTRDPSSREAATKFAKDAKAFSAKHTTSKESARAVLTQIGITTSRGKLTKKYQTQKRSA